MRWKQFFTPVETVDPASAKKLIDENPQGSVTILDVRQPREYEKSHIPGAILIPLAEINDRIEEIDRDKPTVVYCAIGGRSRVAAQMLSGSGFSSVYNLSGGIKAWQGNTAIGPIDQGMDLFTGEERVEEVLITAYSLEKGLRDFYQKMIGIVTAGPARELFHKLFSIELIHQNRLLAEYNRITGRNFENIQFEKEVVSPVMEGGLSTDEYMQLFNADLESTEDIIGLAMSIEAQALDMYHRASVRASDPQSREALQQIAIEEQEHLKLLGGLFDKI